MSRWKIDRVAVLAGRHLVASAGRVILLIAMVATGLLIFLVVNGLSQASRSQLSEAIQADLGLAGIYEIALPADLGIPVDKLADAAAEEIRSAGSRSLLVLADMGSVDTACPAQPENRIEESPLYVVLEEQSTRQLASGPEADAGNVDSRPPVCLLGTSVPVDAQSALGLAQLLRLPEEPVALNASAIDEVSLAFGGPQRLQIVAGLSSDADQSIVLKENLTASLTPLAMRMGLPERWQESITVVRQDQGTAIRKAEDGVRLIYQVLAWGVLALGGIGVLVAQLMTSQSRTWFFGLARVAGATTFDVAAIVIFEVVLLIVLGSLAAVVLAVVLRPAIEAWSAETLGGNWSSSTFHRFRALCSALRRWLCSVRRTRPFAQSDWIRWKPSSAEAASSW
jgi:hypothetical protein